MDPGTFAEALAARARQVREVALARLKEDTKRPNALLELYQAFRERLLHDQPAGDFADAFAQTVTYGLLSARWITRDHRESPRIRFDRQRAREHLGRTSPFLHELFGVALGASSAQTEPELSRLLDDIADLLDRTDVDRVFAEDDGEGHGDDGADRVIHFYEPFLRAYDPGKKRSRGVYFTPRPVVSFIVHRVDEMLRRDLGLSEGLADVTTWGEMQERHPEVIVPEGATARTPFVQILDPATGTGTFVIEVIAKIHATLVAGWRGAGATDDEVLERWRAYVPEHLLPRIHAFEIMMAPYAIAHLNVALELGERGYDPGSNPPLNLRLTNALEAPEDATPITVVLGNPPYSGHSRNKSAWIRRLGEDYKRGCPELGKPAQAKWLSDDYVKFVRFAQWQLERARLGVLGFVTNHAYLDNPTFRGMRRSLLTSFDAVDVLDLHGNSKRQEASPDGSPDENVFDIQQGVAICLAAITTEHGVASGCTVRHADLFGTRREKYAWLDAHGREDAPFRRLSPVEPHFLLVAQNDDLVPEYSRGWSLRDIFSPGGDPAPGVVTTHDQLAISWTAEEAARKVEALLNTRSEAEARAAFRLCSQDQWQYDRAKRELGDGLWRGEIVELLYRPFDVRWTVFNRNVAVHRRERASAHMLGGENRALVTVRQVAEGVYDHVLVTRHPVDNRATASNKGTAFLMPLYLYDDPRGVKPRRTASRGFGGISHRDRRPNLATAFVDELASRIGARFTAERTAAGKGLCADDVFYYLYAVLSSPTYRARYADFLRVDFARVPLPGSAALFRELSDLGERLVAVQLSERSAVEVARAPGRGSNVVERVSYRSAGAPGTRGAVAINSTQEFGDVPEAVWYFSIGGYQVCRKWLKDRKGRRLSEEDIAAYLSIVAIVAQTMREMVEIDAIIARHGGFPAAFHAPPHPSAGR